MPFFKYVARNKSGTSIEETSEAVSREELIKSLQSKGLFVVSVETSQEKKIKKRTTQKRRFHHGVKTSDLIVFSVELATLLGSGVTLIKSLNIIAKQIESRTLLRAIKDITKDVEGGHTFQDALKKHDKIFSSFWIHVIQTGEASGHLPASLEQLATYLEESVALRRKIVSATIYPIILVCLAVVAITVFLLKIIPIFSNIFEGFGIELPLLTQVVINVSNLFRQYFFILVGVIVVVFFILKKYVSTRVGRVKFDRFKLNLPLLGPLFREIATERFTSSLATLLKSGVPVLNALEISEKTAGNKIIESSIRDVKTSVKEGRNMADVMESDGFFSPLVVQMVAVGEEIGELGKMLDKISLFYKERVNTFVARVTTMFEPVALIFMGIIVGILVIAMFLPIFSISSAIR